MNPMRILIVALMATLAAGCGGGSSIGSNGGSSGGGASGSNVMAIDVNLGPVSSIPYVNGVFATITVCNSGGQCQSVDNVLVDTGSSGLRVLSSALNGLSLPTQTSGSNQIGECAPFADGFTWGPVATATLQLGGETASNVPVNVIGASGFPSAPSYCTTNYGQSENTLDTLGANGILGIGLFQQDCGSGCTLPTNNIYYSCSSTLCTSTAEAEANQVQNPVGFFTTDNNGVIVELPSISSGGQQTASGSVVFGIGTESNNGLGSALIVYASQNLGEFSTSASINGASNSYPNSFIDSGSNALYFASSITQCPSSEAPGFYCPSSTVSFNATMTGANNGVVTVPVSVANTLNLNGNYAAFNDLAGTTAGNADLNGSFDWGLPFFYGRNVYIAIEGKSASGNSGPFYAF